MMPGFRPVKHNGVQRGFGLLELMLVVALLGILATIGISTYHLRFQQQQVQKTSLQMQQILQAGMAYYVDQQHWPEALQYGDFMPYVPEVLLDAVNPWQQPYVLVHPNDHRLAVSTRIPDQALAQRVASSLPNAVVKPLPNGYEVVADVTIPGQVSAVQGGVHILAMGEWSKVRDGETKKVSHLDCPGNMRLMVGMTAFRPTIERLVGGDPIAELAMKTSCLQHSCSMTLINQQEINFGKRQSNGSVDLNYMVLCQQGSMRG